MYTYKNFQKIAWRKLPTGQNISFPVPLLENKALVDAAFTYTANNFDHSVGKPLLVIKANLSEGCAEATNASEAFASIVHESTLREIPDSYREKAAEAKALYAEVREETAAGNVGPASKRYAELVWSVTQKPLRPYYRALSPALFADCK